MKKAPAVDSTTLAAILKALAHPKKLQLIQHLSLVKMSTNKLISRALGLSKSHTSKLTKDLVAVGLVSREKVFTQILFMVNREQLEGVKASLNAL